MHHLECTSVAKCPYKALQSLVQTTGQDTNYKACTINSQMSSLLMRDPLMTLIRWVTNVL